MRGLVTIIFSVTIYIVLVSQSNCSLSEDYEIHEEPLQAQVPIRTYNNPSNNYGSGNNPVTSGSGGNTPTDSLLSGNDPSRSGGNNPTDFGSGGHNPLNSGSGGNNPLNSGSGGNNPLNSGAGGNNPSYSGSEVNNPTDLGSGANNPENNQFPHSSGVNNPFPGGPGGNNPDGSDGNNLRGQGENKPQGPDGNNFNGPSGNNQFPHSSGVNNPFPGGNNPDRTDESNLHGQGENKPSGPDGNNFNGPSGNNQFPHGSGKNNPGNNQFSHASGGNNPFPNGNNLHGPSGNNRFPYGSNKNNPSDPGPTESNVPGSAIPSNSKVKSELFTNIPTTPESVIKAPELFESAVQNPGFQGSVLGAPSTESDISTTETPVSPESIDSSPVSPGAADAPVTPESETISSISPGTADSNDQVSPGPDSDAPVSPVSGTSPFLSDVSDTNAPLLPHASHPNAPLPPHASHLNAPLLPHASHPNTPWSFTDDSSKQVAPNKEEQYDSPTDMSVYQPCVLSQCQKVCGSKNSKIARCDSQNKKLCMCSGTHFVTVDHEGKFMAENKHEPATTLCSKACNTKEGYARIWNKPDGTKHCICLFNQKTMTGITLCDMFAVDNECKKICQSENAKCAFDGACICRDQWMQFFNLSIPNVRKEVSTDNSECSKRCLMYHHDFVPRIYDPKMLNAAGPKNYNFKSKYCLCGPEEVEHSYPKTKAIIAQGFQVCTGLRCKQRCGMREAMCEPIYRRACLCRRQNIFIGPHLWTRLPSFSERICQDTCFAQGLQARVVEKNPMLNPAAERFKPWYRNSIFQYQYAGKFCHCVKVEIDMDNFRPCTDELCRWLCGHDEAICDVGTRRNCLCNTHQLIAGLGRLTDPGEVTCDMICRYHLQDAMVIDMTWETKKTDGWGVAKSKFCGCVRPVSEAGLTHCDGMHDICPKLCNNSEAYCTREKYCECGIATHLLNNGTIRLPNGMEAEECGEKCRSWMWPIAEDRDRLALIYDESRVECSKKQNCPAVDTRPWSPTRLTSDMQEVVAYSNHKKYCLCSKHQTIHYSPGTRFFPQITPHKDFKTMECITNHTCKIVGSSIFIKA